VFCVSSNSNTCGKKGARVVQVWQGEGKERKMFKRGKKYVRLALPREGSDE